MQHYGYEFKYDIRGVDPTAPSAPMPAWAAGLVPRIVALLNSDALPSIHTPASARLPEPDNQFGQRHSSDGDFSPSANCEERGARYQEGTCDGVEGSSTVAAACGPLEQSQHLPAATHSTKAGSPPIGAGLGARSSVEAARSSHGEGTALADCNLDQLTVNEYCAGVGLSRHIDTHSAFTGALLSFTTPPFAPPTATQRATSDARHYRRLMRSL